MRAVEKFERMLPIAARLVQPEGRLALMIGSAQTDQAKSLIPEFMWSDPAAIPSGHSRVLLVGTKQVKVE